MCPQVLRLQAMHLAQLLPEDHREAATVLAYVEELEDWARRGQETRGNVIPLLPQLKRPARVRRGIGFTSAIAAALVAFLLGWIMDPPVLGAVHECAVAAPAVLPAP